MPGNSVFCARTPFVCINSPTHIPFHQHYHHVVIIITLDRRWARLKNCKKKMSLNALILSLISGHCGLVPTLVDRGGQAQAFWAKAYASSKLCEFVLWLARLEVLTILAAVDLFSSRFLRNSCQIFFENSSEMWINFTWLDRSQTWHFCVQQRVEPEKCWEHKN